MPKQTEPTSANFELFHQGSTNPNKYPQKYGVSAYYNRDFGEYLAEMNGLFRPEEWVGKSVLDIGSGAGELFGRRARELGIDVTSLDPAADSKITQWHLLQARLEDQSKAQDAERLRFYSQPFLKHLFKKPQIVAKPESRVVSGLAQQMPFDNEAFHGVVSVFGVPHYLHHVDPSLRDDTEKIRSYTPEVREKDKALITQTFQEILRVLKPGGKAILVDEFRSPGQTKRINAFSPSDGTEVVEVLDELKVLGVKVEIHQESIIRDDDIDPSGIKRIIILNKPV